MVPNAALRFQPSTLSEAKIADMVSNAGLEYLSDEQRQIALDARAKNAGKKAATGFPGPMGQGRQNQNAQGGSSTQGGTNQGNNSTPQAAIRNLWFINSDGKLDVVKVQIGISSGTFTEIRDAQNLEGKQIIVKEKS